MEHGAWLLGRKLCSVMVKQEQTPELPVDPLTVATTAAATAVGPAPLLGLSPLSRLPIPHQVSLGSEGGRTGGWAQRLWGKRWLQPLRLWNGDKLGTEGFKCQASCVTLGLSPEASQSR